jgi:SAM-dependent methyltransferase
LRVLRRRKKDRGGPAEAPPVYLDARASFAARFLFGEGLEIGPLHMPLAVPTRARVRSVDRMTVEELRGEYPELADWDLTPVDIVDDGERLSTIPDASQDFIVANHFLEHCEDPIGTIEVHLSKLRPGGILFYAVPDKRYTFDFRRPVTPLDHMIADHEQGPERSRRDHYREWARLVTEDDASKAAKEATEEEFERRAVQLESDRYSIHMHVWSQAEFLNLILHCRERSDGAFDIEAAARQAIEFVVVLRKKGPLPEPSATTSDPTRVAEPEQAMHELTTSASWRLTAPLRAAKRALRRRSSRR